MHRRHKHDIIVIFALIAFGISIYLATAHYLGFTVPCGPVKSCEIVLSSKYSTLLGLPVAVWGVLFFTGVIFSALLANHYALWRKLLTIILALGGLSALGFLSIQFFVLKQVCPYCLTTDLLSILLFLVDMNIEHRQQQI